MKRIYLDHHTCTSLKEEVLQEMLSQMKEGWGSLMQPHMDGQRILKDQERAFADLESALRVGENDDMVLTSSKSEAINHVFDHVYNQVVRESGRNHIISLSSEEASILLCIQRLEKMGCHSTLIDSGDSGRVSSKDIIESITPRTALISLTLAHGLTGIIQDIKEIIEVCKMRKILIHLDVSYAIGKVRIDFSDLGADFVTFGGDTLGGPKSSGLLIAKEEVKLTPFIVGEEEQNGLRGASLDMASLVGLSVACKKAKDGEMDLEIPRLRDLFEKKCSKVEGTTVLFKGNRLPNVSVMSFEGVHSDALLYALNKRGVSASMGGGKFQKLSYLLEKMGYTSNVANCALSFCLSEASTKEEITQAADIIMEEVARLKLLNQKREVEHV